MTILMENSIQIMLSGSNRAKGVPSEETVWTSPKVVCGWVVRGVYRDPVRAGKSYQSAGARRLSRFPRSAFCVASRMLRLSFERDGVALVFARSAGVLGHCP